MKTILTILIILIVLPVSTLAETDSISAYSGAVSFQVSRFHLHEGRASIPDLFTWGGTVRLHFLFSSQSHLSLNIQYTKIFKNLDSERAIPSINEIGLNLDIGLKPLSKINQRLNIFISGGLGFNKVTYIGTFDPKEDAVDYSEAGLSSAHSYQGTAGPTLRGGFGIILQFYKDYHLRAEASASSYYLTWDYKRFYTLSAGMYRAW